MEGTPNQTSHKTFFFSFSWSGSVTLNHFEPGLLEREKLKIERSGNFNSPEIESIPDQPLSSEHAHKIIIPYY